MPPRAPASITGGWRILEGGLYVVESDGPDAMLQAVLAIYYDPDWLAWQGIAPETLQLWQWAPALGRWEPLPDSLSTRLHRVSAAISNLTAYALAAPPRAAVWLPLISSVIPSSN
jgi:hypothetical protein